MVSPGEGQVFRKGYGQKTCPSMTIGVSLSLNPEIILSCLSKLRWGLSSTPGVWILQLLPMFKPQE